MATKTKHMERSHRSYRQNRANVQWYYTNSVRKAEANKYFKEHTSLFERIFGRKNKGDK